MNDDKAKQEKAAAYQLMMSNWAWSDFQKNVLDEIRKEALEAAINSDDIKMIQVGRGMVKTIDRIMSDLDYILQGIT